MTPAILRLKKVPSGEGRKTNPKGAPEVPDPLFEVRVFLAEYWALNWPSNPPLNHPSIFRA
jgi:hypothetical protein